MKGGRYMEFKYKTIPNFLRREGNGLVFDKEGEFIFYVPEVEFGTKSAEIYGSYIKLLGILNYVIIDKNGKESELKTFKWPTIFTSKPSSIEKIKGIKLTKTMTETDYRILHYKNGDEIVSSVFTPQETDNAEEMFRLMFITGKIPTTIPYDKLWEYFDKNMNLNGSDYGLHDQLFGFITSEVARDPKDISVPFRLSKETDMTAYKPISIKETAKYVSPYVAITSENWDESMMSAVMLSNDPNGHKYSPLEKVLTM